MSSARGPLRITDEMFHRRVETEKQDFRKDYSGWVESLLRYQEPISELGDNLKQPINTISFLLKY